MIDPDSRSRIPQGRRRGRGAASNAAGRFEPLTRRRDADGWDVEEDLPPIRTELAMERARTIITRNASPDLPFDRSINPYRGCEHGCVYCFARPSHAYLGLSPGLDFETRLSAKPEAARLLARELRRPGYKVAPIAIGTNTDPYQPVEKRLGIMRQVLEVLRDFGHPVTIVTKSAIVARDADILGEMGRRGLARVAMSLTTLDPRLSRSFEPRAASPVRRLDAIRRLREAGCPVGVMLAPLIPAVNDHEIERLAEAAAEAGAESLRWVALRLPREVAGLFREWLEETRPERADRVMRYVREMHGGRDYDPDWGRRLRGQGVYARLMGARVAQAAARHGLATETPPLRRDLFRPPPENGQLSLF